MVMLESDVGRIGGAGGRRTDGLIQKAGVGVARYLDANVHLTAFGSENAGIEIEAIGLSRSGGKDLGESGAFGAKSG